MEIKRINGVLSAYQTVKKSAAPKTETASSVRNTDRVEFGFETALQAAKNGIAAAVKADAAPQELAQAQQAGYRCAVAFVIQMEGITEVRPNVRTQPEFGTALAEAKAAGVQVLFLLCRVGRDSLEIMEQREG